MDPGRDILLLNEGRGRKRERKGKESVYVCVRERERGERERSERERGGGRKRERKQIKLSQQLNFEHHVKLLTYDGVEHSVVSVIGWDLVVSIENPKLG